MKGYQWREFIPLLTGLIVIALVTIVIPQATRYLSKASGQPANLVINYEGVVGQMPKVWRNLAQGGEENQPMLTEVIGEVKSLQPEYVRIDHIYDSFKVVDKVNGQLTYDWTGLDTAVNEILATGAKPFLSMSYMPTAVSVGDIIDLPKDWQDWGQIVQATIEHYSGKDNRNLSGVIYEVWNEPDLFGSYKTYGDKNYLTMYEVSAKAAMRASNVNSFEIGGPAITALYKNWLERLIKHVASNNLRMDFISWHRYNTDLEVFEEDAKQARKWAEEIPALTDLKFYVTEWGHDSENHAGYDNNFGAIHTLATTRVMMGRINRAFLFEIKDGPGNEKYWGRWGILTHEKFGQSEKKPRFRAIELLNSLYPFRVGVAGEGSWVKSIGSMDQEGDLRILVVNYDPKGKHGEAIPITFDNLPQGKFIYTRKDFLSNGVKSVPVATTSARWQTMEYMNPNSAMVVDIKFDNLNLN